MECYGQNLAKKTRKKQVQHVQRFQMYEFEYLKLLF